MLDDQELARWHALRRKLDLKKACTGSGPFSKSSLNLSH